MMKNLRAFEKTFGIRFTLCQTVRLCARWKIYKIRRAVRDFLWRRKAMKIRKEMEV